MRDVSYTDAVAALKGALKFGINPSLAGIAELCERLDRPQDSLSVIQVTGTNGKSSTCRFVEAILRGEGRLTGLYTSPELERYPERMEVGGEVVSDTVFARAVAAALSAAEEARPGMHGSEAGFTEFELLTAAALWLFRERGVDCGVLEVGLGGRWDATSVAHPRIAVITGVGLDHTAILGDTLEQIAAEKAAIIREGSVAVLGPGTRGLESVFLTRAHVTGAAAFAVRLDTDESPVDSEYTIRFRLTGRPDSPVGRTMLDVRARHADYAGLSVAAPAYQADNIATAVTAAEAWLGGALDAKALSRTLGDIRLPGRFEVLARDPVVIVDGSHNPQASAVLAAAVADAWPPVTEATPAPAEAPRTVAGAPRADVRPLFVLGVLSDKDAEGIVAALAPVAGGFIVTEPDSPRALPARELASIVERITEHAPVERADLAEALALARADGRPFVVTGSLTTAGQARSLLRR